VTADRVNNRNIILTARILLVLVLVANYLVVIMYPSVGVHDYASLAGHKWRGMMSHKNIAGITSAITVLFFVLYGERDTIIPRYCVVFFSVIFLYFSDSRTSMIGLSVSLLIGLLFHHFSPRISRVLSEDNGVFKYIGYSLCAILCLSLVFLTFNIDLVIQATSNPDFLSGRSQIWQPLLTSYAEHPIFGTGYGAFWNNFTTSADYITHEKGNFFTGATQGHNGYLDIAVQTGLLGLLISVAAIIVCPVYYLAKMAGFDKNICSLTLSMMILYVIENFTETSLFEGDNILHVFTMISFGMLWKSIRRTTHGSRIKYGTVIRKRRSIIQ
jgi:exopolysaccharide production protein ExoQ